MPSTVRIDDHSKERLRHLKEAWAPGWGVRPVRQEPIDEALAALETHRGAFRARPAWRPLTPEEIGRLEERFQVPSGDRGRYDVDDVVYGDAEPSD